MLMRVMLIFFVFVIMRFCVCWIFSVIFLVLKEEDIFCEFVIYFILCFKKILNNRELGYWCWKLRLIYNDVEGLNL